MADESVSVYICVCIYVYIYTSTPRPRASVNQDVPARGCRRGGAPEDSSGPSGKSPSLSIPGPHMRWRDAYVQGGPRDGGGRPVSGILTRCARVGAADQARGRSADVARAPEFKQHTRAVPSPRSRPEGPSAQKWMTYLTGCSPDRHHS